MLKYRSKISLNNEITQTRDFCTPVTRAYDMLLSTVVIQYFAILPTLISLLAQILFSDMLNLKN